MHSNNIRVTFRIHHNNELNETVSAFHDFANDLVINQPIEANGVEFLITNMEIICDECGSIFPEHVAGCPND